MDNWRIGNNKTLLYVIIPKRQHSPNFTGVNVAFAAYNLNFFSI
jgi:hypothetical protein